MKYFSKNVGDFSSATKHLSLVEKGAYNELMDHYYATEKPLPAELDALCRITGAFSEVDRAAVAKVACEFFETVDGCLFQAKIENQIARYNEEAEKNRLNGQGGGRPKKPSGLPTGFDMGSPNETQGKANQYPVTSNKSKASKPKAQKPATPPFDLPSWVPIEAWEGFLAMRKSIRKPVGEAAWKLAVKKLDDLRALGHDPKLVLEESTLKSWVGLFPLSATSRASPTGRSGKFDPVEYVNRNRPGAEENDRSTVIDMPA